MSELADYLRATGSYREVRELQDGTLAGIGKLLFTTAIYLDLEPLGWGRRFCFEDHARAEREFQALTDSDHEPTGWVARR